MKSTDYKETLTSHTASVSLSSSADHLSIDQQVNLALHPAGAQSTEPAAPGSAMPGMANLVPGFASSSLGAHDPSPGTNAPGNDQGHGSSVSAASDLSMSAFNAALDGLDAKFADFGQTDPTQGGNLHSDLFGPPISGQALADLAAQDGINTDQSSTSTQTAGPNAETLFGDDATSGDQPDWVKWNTNGAQNTEIKNSGTYTDDNGDLHRYTFDETKTDNGYSATYKDIDTKTGDTWVNTDIVNGQKETVPARIRQPTVRTPRSPAQMVTATAQRRTHLPVHKARARTARAKMAREIVHKPDQRHLALASVEVRSPKVRRPTQMATETARQQRTKRITAKLAITDTERPPRQRRRPRPPRPRCQPMIPTITAVMFRSVNCWRGTRRSISAPAAMTATTST